MADENDLQIDETRVSTDVPLMGQPWHKNRATQGMCSVQELHYTDAKEHAGKEESSRIQQRIHAIQLPDQA